MVLTRSGNYLRTTYPNTQATKYGGKIYNSSTSSKNKIKSVLDSRVQPQIPISIQLTRTKKELPTLHLAHRNIRTTQGKHSPNQHIHRTHVQMSSKTAPTQTCYPMEETDKHITTLPRRYEKNDCQHTKANPANPAPAPMISA